MGEFTPSVEFFYHFPHQQQAVDAARALSRAGQLVESVEPDGEGEWLLRMWVTNLVMELERQDVNALAEALRRGEHDVSQAELERARDDLAAATRLRDALQLAVNQQRARVVAACQEHQGEWAGVLEARLKETRKRYQRGVTELRRAQQELAGVADSLAMIASPSEHKRKHAGPYAGRDHLRIGSRAVPWTEVNSALAGYGEPVPAPTPAEATGSGWLPRPE